MILRKFTHPVSSRQQTIPDIDSFLPPSLSPAPATPISVSNSKTHAFFGSPFSSQPKISLGSSRESGKINGGVNSKSQTKKSLTLDFFSTASPTPPPATPKRSGSDSKHLNLDLFISDTSTPSSPSSIIAATPTQLNSESAFDWSSEPTPRPPALVLKTPTSQQHLPSLLFNFESLASPIHPSNPTPIHSPLHHPEPLPGAKEDAEILPPSGCDNDPGSIEESLLLAPGMIIHSLLHPTQSTQSSSSANSLPSTSSTHSSLLPPSDSHLSNGSHEQNGDVSLLLSRRLGSGAFSNVWLAEDLSSTSLLLKTKKSLRDLKRKSIRREARREAANGKLKEPKRSSSLMKTLSDGIYGTKPYGHDKKQFEGLEVGTPASADFGRDRISSASSAKSVYLDEKDGDGDIGPSISRQSSLSWKSDSSENHAIGRSNSSRSRSGKPKLVAVKFTLRGSIEHDSSSPRGEEDARERDRLRVSFVREVEILKHISHPNITPLLCHLTTRTHHLLVLPYCSGGDLLGLIHSDAWHSLTESVVRRIWMELCRAVGWMHGVGLVHRDIKLENILLTTSIVNPLPISPAPLIQLTDFGLSRFIDPAQPMLTTRCGSEAYAAPELVVLSGRKALTSSPSRWGTYDLEHTMGSGYDARESDAWSCGVALYELVTRELPFGDGPGGRNGYTSRAANSKERRQWLIKIARAQWKWPEPEGVEEEMHLMGKYLVYSAGVRRMVAKLLVKDPSKRARIVDLWDDGWMQHEEESTPSQEQDEPVGVRVNVWRASQAFEDLPDEDEMLENEIYEDGWIVDGDGISNIAMQEVL